MGILYTASASQFGAGAHKSIWSGLDISVITHTFEPQN